MAETRTSQRILERLRDGPAQAKEVAEVVDVDTSAAYRHLERLRADGLVQADEVVQGPGRPKKVYQLTEEGWEAFPRDYKLLLSALIDAIQAGEGPRTLQGYLDHIARALGEPLAELEDVDDRLDGLVALYNDLGFQAHLERDGDQVVLVQRNCPFLQVAKDDPDALCRCLDEGIQRAALPGTEVELESTMAEGARRCRHRLAGV